MTFILLAGLLGWFAADPFEGNWQLNAAKSKGAIPGEETVVIHADGKQLAVEVSIVNSDAAKTRFTIKYIAPVDGGPGYITEGPYSGVSLKRIDPRTLETTYLLKDAQVRTTTAVVSKDGKSMTSSGQAIGTGQQPAWVMVFDKR
jgi:hypothetical protein